MIYTSYFAKLNQLPHNIVPVSICGKAPDWYNGFQYKKLAPKYDFFMKWKENHDNEYYIKCYNEQVLSKLDPYDVLREIRDKITDGRIILNDIDIALICYEKPGDFCHRHLVAEWLHKHDIRCEEYSFNKE